MAVHADIDTASAHLTSYTRREPWPALRLEHVARLLGPIPAAYGLDDEAIFHEVYRLGHIGCLIGFLDEAFLSGEHGPEGRNPIDDYLRRRGWQETPRAREYLQGLRQSRPTLYEVQEVACGEWVDVRDRLGDGPTQRVFEHSATQKLQRWDCLVARVVVARGERMFTGGVLALTRDIAAAIEALYQRVTKAGRKSVATAERELGLAPGALGDAGNPAASFTDRICFHVWLRALLDISRRPPPEMQNTDGDPLLLARTQLQMAPGAAAEVGRRLDQLAGWNRESDEPRWVWTSERKAQSATIRGTARLETGALIVETNSRRRMEQALQELYAALGPLVTAAPTRYEDPMRAMQERAGRPGGEVPRDEPAPGPEYAAAVAEAIRHAKDTHYRRTLDEPIPMLGNRTPRQCRRSKEGRALLLDWLKQIENHELRQAAESGAPPYDPRWMWQELGVEGQR